MLKDFEKAGKRLTVMQDERPPDIGCPEPWEASAEGEGEETEGGEEPDVPADDTGTEGTEEEKPEEGTTGPEEEPGPFK